MNKENYQKKLDSVLCKPETAGKTLFLHCCCAPCSSYVLEYLGNYFRITVFYYNPNIMNEEEYQKRLHEVERLIHTMPLANPVTILPCEHEVSEFLKIAKGKEDLKEGGERCYDCYKLRLEKTARLAKEHHFDYFGTTLSISPYKNATWLNEIGESLAKEYRVPYLYADFKKKNGYKRSIELSKEYDLYRQNYCGCVFSRREAENRLTD